MSKSKTDLLLAGSPTELVEALRAAAQQFKQDAENLKDIWKDGKAGAIWDLSATLLEVAATKIETKLNQL